MKVQELLENEEQVVRFNTIDEYQEFIYKLSTDDDAYHFEEIEDGGELYDIIARVYDFNHQRGNDDYDDETTIDWAVEWFGSGNFDNETDFWFMKGKLPLDSKIEDNMEEHMIEDQMRFIGQPETRDEYEADDRRTEDW